MTKHFRTSAALAALMALGACGVFKGAPKKTPTIGNRVPILVSEGGVEADKTIADVQVMLPAPQVNPDWSQPGGNAAKSMGQLTLAEQPQRLWQASIDGGSVRDPLASPPVVAENKLFVVDAQGRLVAFTADTGTRLWSAEITEGNENRLARFGGGASYDSGTVYATDGLGDVIAANAADGKVLWRAKPSGPLRGSPTIANGNVYVLTQDNQLYAINQTDGKVVWAGQGTLETQGVLGVAAPAASQGTVVAGFSSGELNAYRYENGRMLWQDALSRTSISTSVSTLSDIDAAPVIDQGRVYALGQGGRMVALELSTGQRLWEQNFAGISTPWIAGEWIFLVTDDARLVALARSSGKARWIAQLQRFRKEKKKIGPIIWFGPVLAGNRLILTNSEGQIVYANPGDGTVQAKVKTNTPFSLPPIVANGTLYVLNQKGRITAYK
ncbi:PQQ-binding-like beta-propeller repeat protein [Sphingomonadaceae bacterium jetA1]|jgi:outer membrane protein assembly factor BamB|uniref:outer membrane protein assembly factor BamB family protein n=1 Tax=Facivitalis istanbulensis TaxID=3075838 RepID=UPI003487C2AB